MAATVINTNQVPKGAENIPKSISNLDKIRGVKDLAAVDIILKARSEKAEKKTEFLDKFEKIKSEKVRTELENIFDKIEIQSEKIGEKIYLKDLIEYKRLVKDFLQVATTNSHQFSSENFLDRRGRHRTYSLVKTVDRELDSLTKDFISGHIDHMGVMAKIGEIKGMLLDIMM